MKETSLNKQEMLPDLDHMDVGARQETLPLRGEPVMYQMCLVPAYALTIHKTQALSIKHLVIGCLELWGWQNNCFFSKHERVHTCAPQI